MNTFFKKKKTWISSAHQGFVSGNMFQNTLPAYALAAEKGADMIETDARKTKDGVLIINHDPIVKGFDSKGNYTEYVIEETDFSVISGVCLTNDGNINNRIPRLEEVLDLAYFSGMSINIDLKNGILYAEEIADMVIETGMRGRTVYATNGAGPEAIIKILSIDPEAKFIDTKANYTKEKLSGINGYQTKCFVYTGDFSEANISEIRESGCMLATISLNADNAMQAFKYHPDMAEYPHTSDFEYIDRMILENF